MGVVILKTDGMPVQLDSSFTGINKFDVNGFLVEFNNNGVYKFYQKGDFSKSDQEGILDLEGYYKETDYLKYIQDFEDDVPSITELKGTKFKFGKYKAKVRDSVIVKVVDFDIPFEAFYREKTYTFDIEKSDYDDDIKYYKIGVYQDQRLIYWKVNIPESIEPVVNQVNLLTTPSGYFYTKNFGADVNNWAVTAAEKSNIKQMATLISYKIYYIEQEIIQKIMTAQELSVIEAEANSRTGDVSSLTGLELLVFNLKKSWGYFYAPNSDPSYIHRHSFDKIFSGNPDYSEYRKYYLSLVNFYQKVYPQRDLLLAFEQNDRLKIMFTLLTASGVNAIPYNIRKGLIKDFLKQKNITEEDEQFIVKIILSIDSLKADDFLDFLLMMQDGKTSTFESLYNLLDDARLERYTIVNWFVDERTNRKYFVFAVHELWKVSKYNIQYVPSGTITIGDVDINPNAYFIQHSDEFIFENILSFSTTDASSGGTLQDIEISFESSFNGKRIKINKKEQKIQFVETAGEFSTVTKLKLPAKIELFGNFHMYQSISLSGYNVNFDLKIPEKSNLPAFLFHYIKEYDELADFDAAVTLAIDLTIEAVLFYFTGGASVLKDLRYLKYLTKLGRALRGTLPASEVITVWRGLENVSEVFTLTAGALFVINEYLIATETDPVKRAFKEKLRLLFLGLLIVGAGTSLLSRSRSVREATEILDDIAALPSGVAHGISADVILLLNRLKGNRVVSTTLFANRLSELNLDNLASGYASFSDDLKLAFWNDFKVLDNAKDVGGLIELNKNVQHMNNWLDLRNIGALQEAKTIDFLIDQKLVDGIKRYFNDIGMKESLLELTYENRRLFLKKFADETEAFFNLLRENPQKIKEWAKLDGSKRLMLENNRNFWLVNNFDNITIGKLQVPLEEAKTTIIKRNGQAWFTNPDKKYRAEEFLKLGKNWSNGNLMEIPSVNFLKGIINNNESVYLKVDIGFFDNLGEKISGTIQEIDGLILNTSNGKFEKLISIKLNLVKHDATKDFSKLTSLIKNLPENLDDLKFYVNDVLGLKYSPKKINQISSCKITYRDFNSGKEVTEDLSTFKLKIKSSYDTSDDFYKIHPEILNTTRAELIESSYQSLKKKF